MDSLYLYEIFSAIQGEGPYVGERQVFVRCAGCNLRCVYCDQPEALVRTPRCRIEQTPGRRDFVWVDNPLSASFVAGEVTRLDQPRGLHRSVSLTGGEPLLQSTELLPLCEAVRGSRLQVYLETHGAAPTQMAELRDVVDVVAMDIKLPSSSREKPLWDRHAEFLRHCQPGKAFVKIVVDESTSDEEILTAARLVAARGDQIPFILQPVTPFGESRPPPSPERLLEMQAAVVPVLRDVRVIPQTHKMIGQL